MPANRPTVTIHDLRNTHAAVSVVPTCQQIQQQAAEQEHKERNKQLMEMSDEQWAQRMRDEMPMSEMLKGLRDQLHLAYQDASFLLIGSKPTSPEYTTISLEYTGQPEALAAALCECMQHSKTAIQLVNQAMLMFCKHGSDDEAEMAITELQDIIKQLQERNDPETQIRLKQAELKRLRKAGRLDLATVKEQEIEQIRQEIAAAKEKAQREERRREQLKGYLVLAREALAKKREKARKAKQQQQNPPQPNFAKMAKKRLQQIAARQAEKKKKKASAGGSDNIRSCSQMLNH